MNALPIARIEASILIGFSKVGYLVVLIACTLEAVNEHLKELQTKLLTKFLHTPEVSKPRKWRALLINQMISRNVWDIKCNNTLKIILPSRYCLPWQAINQVQANVINPDSSQTFDSLIDLLSIMTSIQEYQIIFLETLHTHTHTIDG